MADLKQYLQQAAQLLEGTLDELVPLNEDVPESELYEAMRYSLLAGGKRLRPALFLATLEMFELHPARFVNFAAGLEMIHTYSLIHDDLPAMDNDDLRRGQPTCHKAYSETTAILAGDALLTHAFTAMALPIPGIEPKQQMAALLEVSWQAGLGGMVRGQATEFAMKGRKMGRNQLEDIYLGKTSALFIAAVVAAAELAGADDDEIAALRQYAARMGVAFQIIDDVLDVEGEQAELGKQTGSDAKNSQSTYASLLGTEKARRDAEFAAHEAVLCLENFGERADLLREFPQAFVQRSM